MSPLPRFRTIVTARLGKVSKSSVRKELVALKHLFRLACGEWKLLPRFAESLP